MADYRYENAGQPGQPMKKADLIIKKQNEFAVKVEELLNQTKLSNTSLETVLGKLDEEALRAKAQGEEIRNAVNEDYESLMQELRFLALQNESIYDSVAEKVKEIHDLAEKIAKQEDVAEKPEAEEVKEEPVKAEPQPVEIDYDLLADKVAQRIPAPQVVSDGTVVQQVEPVDYDLLVDKLIARMPQQETAVAVAEAEPIDLDVLADKVAQRLPAVETAPVAGEIDYELLADKVAERMPRQEVAMANVSAIPVVAEQNIDYDILAQKVAQYIPATSERQTVSVAVPDIDMDFLADKVVSRIPMQESVSPDYIASRVAEQLIMPRSGAEVDYEVLAEKVAEKLVLPQSVAEIDSEAIAQKVLEKLELPQATAEVDNDYIAEKVLERINQSTATGNVDCDYIASQVAEKIVLPEPKETSFDYDYLAHRVAEQIVIPEVEHNSAVFASAGATAEINEQELADAIALKVGSLKPEDFDILVDDEGCASISAEIAKKLDYDLITATVADKLREALVNNETEEFDYDEIAQRISEKITVTGISEDAIADKAAAILSNYIPEIDGDEIADKVAEQVISALPSLDNSALSENISARLIESQQDNDYQVVLDEEGIEKVSESIYATEEVRFDEIDRELAEIKELLNGKLVVQKEVASASAYEVTDDSLVTVSEIIETYEPVEEEVEEIEEEVIEEPVEEPVEEVTEPAEEVEEEVSEEQPEEEELVEEEVEEEPVEEPVEEVTETEEYVEEEVSEEQPEEEETVEEETSEEIVEEVVEEPVEETPAEEVAEAEETEEEDDSDENDSDEEVDYDGQNPNGVDFANMMRYNRSFIARIIQSSDEQKKYYGEVRSALLSYRKVNSNIAWGAERFHKGRETIARFKIRGKTLVLYLALDPAAHEFSVYHHKDVSSNKSLNGTPMMIKVKSPLGVKKAVRLIDEMLEARDGVKRSVPQRDYAAMYPYESIEELIEDGLVKDVKKK